MNKIYILLLCTIFFSYNTYSSPNLKVYKFKISGKVKYMKNADANGAYGCNVQIFMKKANNTLAQPTGISLNPKDLTYVLDADGNFNFDLQFESNLQLYNKILLVVLPYGPHGNVHHYDPNYKYLIKSSYGKIEAINESFGFPVNVVELDFDNNKAKQEYTYSNMSIEMAPEFGNIIRTLKYSYDCSNNMLARLNYDKKMPGLPIYIVKKIYNPSKDLDGGFFRPIYNTEAYVEIKEGSSKIQTVVSHEYGHHFHYVLNYTHFPISNYNDINHEGNTNYSREAIAEFYGRIIRGYISEKSGKMIPGNSDFETIPFDKDRFKDAAYSETKERQVPRRASYLWNLYDGPTQINMGSTYAGFDNDDIDGGKDKFYKKIFSVISFSSLTTISDMSAFNNSLKKGYPGDMQNSIQKIYDCMMGSGEKRMRPVQIKSAQLTNVPYTNEHKMEITSAGYDQELYFANNTAGYKFYGKKNNDWQLIKKWDIGDDYPVKEFILTPEDIKNYSQFQVTSFNTSGDACAPLAVKHEKLTIDILGLSQIDADKIYVWKSGIKGGQAPYTYQWRLRKTGADKYLSIDPDKSNNPNYSTSAPDGENFVIDVLVKDKNGVTGYAAKTVYATILPLAVNINGSNSIGANMEGSWTAEISGGVPPYDYNWSKFVQGSPQLIYLGQNSKCKTNAGVLPFDLKLVVKDAKNKNAFITKKITIDQTVSMNVELTGDKITYLHKPGHWKVDVTGGAVPYKATVFKRRKEGSNQFSLIAYTTTDQCEKLFTEEGVYYLKALVTDHNGKSKESQEFKVTAIYQPVYATIINFLATFKYGAYYTSAAAKPEGGKLPYYYQWSIGTSLNDLKPIPGATDSILKPYKATMLAGNYILALKVTDTKLNSVTAYQYFTFGDPLDFNWNPSKPPVTGIHLNSYPNPTSGITTISYELQQASMVDITIINARTGERSLVVKEWQPAGRRQLTRNLAALPGGVYEIQVKLSINNKEEIYTSSLIIAK